MVARDAAERERERARGGVLRGRDRAHGVWCAERGITVRGGILISSFLMRILNSLNLVY